MPPLEKPVYIMRILFTLFLLCQMTVASADHIEIRQAWIPEAPPVSRVHAGYFEIHNSSGTDALLSHASSDAYDSVEVHLSIEKDGVASMRRVEAVKLPAGSSVSFEPGGYHLMLIGPHEAKRAGDKVAIRISLDDGTQFDIEALVKKHDTGHSHHHHH